VALVLVAALLLFAILLLFAMLMTLLRVVVKPLCIVLLYYTK
jgi:hypothetical protein